MHRDHAGDPEDDHSQWSGTPPVLPERAQAMAALQPSPKDAKQYKPRTQHEANALHGQSLPLGRPGGCPVH